MADEPTTPAPEPETDPAADPQPEESKGDPWADPEAARREIEKLRRENASHRTRNKELEPLAEAARQAEEAKKSEVERLAEQVAAAQQQVTAARQAAVQSEVRALAAPTFADPADAAAFLGDAYVGDDGSVDSDRIRADLADLLERKPHLARPQDGPRRPAPDPTQGSSGNGARTASDPGAQFAAFMKGALGR